MRPLQPRSTTSDEHAEAVSRRLATLSAELAAVRGDPPVPHRHTQVRHPDSAESVDPDIDPSQAPVIPVPGRHASRRLVGSLSARLPVTGAHVAVIAVVIAVAVGMAAWLALRSAPEPLPALMPASEPLSSPSVSAPPSGQVSPSGSPSPSATGGDVTVDVAGKVRRPGIAVLPPGSRVVDAVEAAGGARRGVDLASLNLARPLVDGEQILVGVAVPTGVLGSLGAPGSDPPGESVALVNLNTGDLAALETLPGVGPVTAQSIVDWRTEHGAFTRVEELLEVDGIGDVTLAEIAPHVTI